MIDEFQRAGGEVISLNHQLGRTAEDDLLLQVEGMVAEDERAKILERSRRGKRHAAHCGAASVLSAAPYGYRYINKQDGAGSASVTTGKGVPMPRTLRFGSKGALCWSSPLGWSSNTVADCSRTRTAKMATVPYWKVSWASCVKVWPG